MFFGGITVALFLIAVLYYFLVPKKYDWQLNYSHNGDEPYGFEFIDEIMDENPSVTLVNDKIGEYLDSNATRQKWIYLNERLYSSDASKEALLNWVSQGNELVFILHKVPDNYMLNLVLGSDSVKAINKKIRTLDSIYDLQELAYEKVYSEEEYYYEEYDEYGEPVETESDSAWELYHEIAPDSLVPHYFSESAEFQRKLQKVFDWEEKDTSKVVEITSVGYSEPVQLYYQVREDTLVNRYNGFRYIRHSLLDSHLVDYKPLGFIDEGKVVDFEVTYGKGKIRMHLLPIAFTNFHIKRPEVWAYNQFVLGAPADTTFYDFTSHREYDPYDYDFSGGLGQSPLYFILNQPPLKWAWYLLLGTVIIYFLFKLKRERPEIPVVRPNPNTSLEYAKAIGYLRKTEYDLFTLADEMYVDWEATLRKHFRTTDLEKTLEGKGYLSKFPEAEREVETINNYKRKLVEKQSLEAYEIKLIHNLFVSLHKRISQ